MYPQEYNIAQIRQSQNEFVQKGLLFRSKSKAWSFFYNTVLVLSLFQTLASPRSQSSYDGIPNDRPVQVLKNLWLWNALLVRDGRGIL